MSSLSSLNLHNFRCYERAALENLSAGLIVLYGPNGAGKTNVLEAVSLLTPGRGLRGARNLEMQRSNTPPHPNPPPNGGREEIRRISGGGGDQPWAISASINRGLAQSMQIGTGIDPATEKRIVRINGENVKSQAALSDFLSCVWITPQMDRLFLDSSGHRRRFLDRMVFAFDPGHAGRVSRYENALAQRSRLLRDHAGYDVWLSALESQIAETGTAIAAARLHFVEKLQHACDSFTGADYFPHARLEARGSIEELLRRVPALEAEDIFKANLFESRARDAITGGAASGPHKSDLFVVYAAKNMAADQCSTGEQKALLIGIVLAHAELVKRERGAAPVILLDEIAAHLDENRRAALYEILQSTGGQVWMTGTDESLFAPISNSAAFFHVASAAIKKQDNHAAALALSL